MGTGPHQRYYSIGESVKATIASTPMMLMTTQMACEVFRESRIVEK